MERTNNTKDKIRARCLTFDRDFGQLDGADVGSTVADVGP